MLRSLVGSEMCIRDRCLLMCATRRHSRAPRRATQCATTAQDAHRQQVRRYYSCMTRRHSHTCSGCAKPSHISRQHSSVYRKEHSVSSRHSTRTVYFVSMNIHLYSPPEANGTFFRLHFQPQKNSLSTFYILNLKGTHISLDSQEDTSTPCSTSALAVIYHSSELLRLRYSLFV